MKKIAVLSMGMLASLLNILAQKIPDLSKVQTGLESNAQNVFGIVSVIVWVLFIIGAVIVIGLLLSHKPNARDALLWYLGALIFWGVIFFLFQ